jgi:LmbE family N-acetylglucosaminyl deacetylase
MALTFYPNDQILVLSPHLDDAILSLGGSMASWSDAGAVVTALTVFTADAPESSLQSTIVKEMHELWNLGEHPYATRRSEDIAATEVAGANYIHGNLPDCIYRQAKDGSDLYPSEASVYSASPASAEAIYGPLKELIVEWLNKIKPTLVLAPLGIGRHVDHFITSKVFREISHDAGYDVALYEEIPYATGKYPTINPDNVPAAKARTEWNIRSSELVEIDFERKRRAIECYQSQLIDIFPDGFGALKDYMATLQQDHAVERIWRVDTRSR